MLIWTWNKAVTAYLPHDEINIILEVKIELLLKMLNPLEQKDILDIFDQVFHYQPKDVAENWDEKQEFKTIVHIDVSNI